MIIEVAMLVGYLDIEIDDSGILDFSLIINGSKTVLLNLFWFVIPGM